MLVLKRGGKEPRVVPNHMDMSVETRQTGQSRSVGASERGMANLKPWTAIVQACVSVTPALTELLSSFWGVPVKLVFLGASANTHYFWRADDFHVSRLQLEKAADSNDTQAMALLRLSEALCATLLTRVLGPRSSSLPGFSFKQLSPLEATILNEFSRDLLATFRKSLLKKPARRAQSGQFHLIWVMALEEPGRDLEQVMAPLEARQFLEGLETGKIVLSLPANAIQLPEAGLAQNETLEVADDFFFHTEATARIFVGSGQVPLVDLDGLEPGDLIVLEESESSRMALIEPQSGDRLPFQVEIANPQSITIPYTQEFDGMDTQPSGGTTRQQLWDNLMIEVGAEFEPVKLPLKQLKQMSEGLIIELGDLVHNQVSLRVEGKALALGELVIVGDKFGVRVSRLLADGAQPPMAALPSSTQEAPKQKPTRPRQEAAQPKAKPEQDGPTEQPAANAEEDVNLDNFLNEDFDETFEDGEEDW